MSRWLLALLVACAAALPLLGALDGPFVRDDHWIAARNPALEATTSPVPFFTDPGTYSLHEGFNAICYRPLMSWTMALDVARAGHAPRSFRVTHVALHALAMALGFLLLLRLLEVACPEAEPGRRQAVALVAALLAAAHPVSAFAARYVSNRGFLLFVVFYYGALLASLRGRPGLTFLAATMGLCSKETAVVVPVALLAMEAARPPPWAPRGAARRVAPGLAALVLYFVVRAALGLGTDQLEGAAPGLAERLGGILAQGWVQLTTYLPALAWPPPVRWDPPAPAALPLPWSGLGAWLVLAGLVAASWRGLGRRHPLTLGLLLYPVSMIPTTLLLQPVPANYYRPYPGLLFLFAGLAWLASARVPRSALLALGVLAAGVLGWQSSRQGAADASEATMWARARRYGLSPQGALRAAEAEPDPRARLASLDALLAGPRPLVRAHRARATTRLLLGDAAGALADLEAAEVSGASLPPEARLQRAVAAALLGRPPRDAGPFRPRDVLQLAGAAFQVGQAGVAQAALDAPMTDPGADRWRLEELRGVLAHQAGEPARAAAHYRAVLAAGASPPGLRANLGVALRQLGRCAEALPHLEVALLEDPGDGVAQANLQACRMPPEEAR